MKRKPLRKVKILMMIRDVKMVDLAVEIGVSVPTMNAYLNGYRKVPNRIKKRIAEVLDKPVEEIFDED